MADQAFQILQPYSIANQMISLFCFHLFSIRVSLVAQWQRIHRQCRRRGLDPCVRKIPWRRNQQHTPVILPRKSQGQRSPAGYSPWVARVRHHLANKPPPVRCLWYQMSVLFLFLRKWRRCHQKNILVLHKLVFK